MKESGSPVRSVERALFLEPPAASCQAHARNARPAAPRHGITCSSGSRAGAPPHFRARARRMATEVEAEVLVFRVCRYRFLLAPPKQQGAFSKCLQNGPLPKVQAKNAKDREDQAETRTATKTLNSLRRPALQKKAKQTAQATEGLQDPVAAEVPAEDYISTDAVRPKAMARVTPQARVTQEVKAKGRPLAKGKVKAKTDLFEDAVELAEVDESLPTEFGVEVNPASSS